MRFRIKVETSALLCILLLGISLSATAQQAQSTSTSVAGGKPNVECAGLRLVSPAGAGGQADMTTSLMSHPMQWSLPEARPSDTPVFQTDQENFERRMLSRSRLREE